MRDSRVLKSLLGLGMAGVVALGIVALVAGTPAEAHNHCLACIPEPGMPLVYCSDGKVYPNICAAQANCQYDCVAFAIKN